MISQQTSNSTHKWCT